MNLLSSLLIIPALGVLTVSCVKTGAEDCPTPAPDAAQYTVRIGVLDKNYANAQTDDPASVKDENLPLQSYVGSLYYELAKVDAAGNRSAQVTPSAQEKEHVLTFNDLTPGRYILTVWGNSANKGNLHTGNDEGTDVYLGTDTLDFDGKSVSTTLQLQRTKGQVKVIYKNLPSTIVRIREQLGSVYQNVDQNFGYGGSATIIKTVPANSSVTMLAAPSPLFQNSTLNIGFFTATDTDTPSIVLPDISVKLLRNGLSVIEVDYGGEGSWEIWNMVNGEWKLIHDETLEQN